MPGPKQYAMTLQDVAERIADETSLDRETRGQLRSAIATFARACGRSPSEIIADAHHINHLLAKASWQRLGISKRTWANVESRIRTALQATGVNVAKRRNFKLSPVWQKLLAPLSRKKRQDLSRFAGFCTLRAILPPKVTVIVFEEFLCFCQEQVIQLDGRERWQAARRAWNHLVAAAPELKLPQIPNTSPPRWRGLTWEELPEQLKADLKALNHWLVTVDPVEEEREPIKPLTANQHVNNLRRYVSHLVEMGVPLEELSLPSLLEIDLVRRFFRFQADKRGKTREQLKQGGDPTLYVYLAALMAAARFLRASDDQWRVLKQIGDLVRRKQMELTPKNRARIKTLSAPDVEGKYLNLPLTIDWRLRGIKTPTIAQALQMQAAAALEFMIKAPLRIDNVAKLDLERHIRRQQGGVAGNWLVHFEGHEVKNGEPVHVALSEKTSALLDRYLTTFRPVLLRKGPLTAFFVTKDGKPKSKDALRKQLQKLIRRELGVEWNPHIVRAHAGWMTLEERPGNFRGVQQMLGHRKPETTACYYLGMERERAFAEYDGVIERRRAAALAGAVTKRSQRKR